MYYTFATTKRKKQHEWSKIVLYLTPDDRRNIALDTELGDAVPHVAIAVLAHTDAPSVLVVQSMVYRVDPGHLHAGRAADPGHRRDGVRVLLRDRIAGTAVTHAHSAHQSTELVHGVNTRGGRVVVLHPLGLGLYIGQLKPGEFWLGQCGRGAIQQGRHAQLLGDGVIIVERKVQVHIVFSILKGIDMVEAKERNSLVSQKSS